MIKQKVVPLVSLALIMTGLALILRAPVAPPPAFVSYEAVVSLAEDQFHFKTPQLDGPEDGLYWALSQTEIDQLIKYCAKHQAFGDGEGYLVDGWDCDNFSHEFLNNASVWARNYRPNMPASPAVAVLYVGVRGDMRAFGFPANCFGLHAMVGILRNDGEWFLFEPQTGKLAPATLYVQAGVIKVFKLQM